MIYVCMIVYLCTFSLFCCAELQLSDIQAMLGDSVNCLVKHFHKPEKEVVISIYA